MITCDFSEFWCYDPTGELAEPCNRPSVGSCSNCESDVCLSHGQMCACGKVFCESCRAQHEIECEDFKLQEYQRIKKYAEQRA